MTSATNSPNSSNSSNSRVHIVGAGIAGLACAVRLVQQGRQVVLYEAAAQAGGRCRSYHDAQLDCVIDNGNHLLLSANQAALGYLEEIGARDSVIGPDHAVFPFVDLASGEQWTVRPNAGRLPWWILVAARRIPHTRPGAYLAGLRLAFAKPEDRVTDCLDPNDPLWSRFWQPLTIAALNTPPEQASARLLWRVLKETFALGEAACRPLIARRGLAASLIEPALAVLEAQACIPRFNQRLRAITFEGKRAATLDFGAARVELEANDRLILALPPAVTASLLPGLSVPEESCAIVNGHIRLPRPPNLPGGADSNLPFLGMIGGTADWLFVRGSVVSLTVSAANDLAEESSDAIAKRLWADTTRALNLDPAVQPPTRIIKERRATFAQTPKALVLRASTETAWPNLMLAGDWTDTGYPATIESAVRSGWAAAQAVH